jgi:hypothetical protein
MFGKYGIYFLLDLAQSDYSDLLETFGEIMLYVKTHPVTV